MVTQQMQKGASARKSRNWIALGEKKPRYTCRVPAGWEGRDSQMGRRDVRAKCPQSMGDGAERGPGASQPHLHVYRPADAGDGLHGADHRAAVVGKVADDGHHGGGVKPSPIVVGYPCEYGNLPGEGATKA